MASLAAGALVSYNYGVSRGKFSHLSNVHYDVEYFMRRIGEAVDSIVHDCFKERCHRLYELEDSKRAPNAGEEVQTKFLIRRAVDDPKQRWIDGTPLNTHYIWALATMFPDAKFIHNLRHPSEVATSLEGFDKLGQASVALSEGLGIWASHSEAAALGEQALGHDKVFRLHFERISSEPEKLVRDLCAFLGEEFSSDCLIPLTQRINSSDVDERRSENAQRLKEIPEYQRCEAIYDEIAWRPSSSQPDESALNTLRERFVEYCRHHPLL